LTGQRPCDVSAVQRDHITIDGFWQMPGEPVGNWPGTGRDHRVWLSEPAQMLVDQHLAGQRSSAQLMRELVATLKIERATPHDLRQTFPDLDHEVGLWPRTIDRVANHKTSSVTDVYDRHGYADEDRRIMAAGARHVLGVVEGAPTQNVVNLR
jgi:integrase